MADAAADAAKGAEDSVAAAAEQVCWMKVLFEMLHIGKPFQQPGENQDQCLKLGPALGAFVHGQGTVASPPAARTAGLAECKCVCTCVNLQAKQNASEARAWIQNWRDNGIKAAEEATQEAAQQTGGFFGGELQLALQFINFMIITLAKPRAEPDSSAARFRKCWISKSCDLPAKCLIRKLGQCIRPTISIPCHDGTCALNVHGCRVMTSGVLTCCFSVLGRLQVAVAAAAAAAV